jgi:hypothetical protein
LPDAIVVQDKKVQKYEHVAKEKDTGYRRVKEKPPTSPERRNLLGPVAAALSGEANGKSHPLFVQSGQANRLSARGLP